jgi:hypothetical protein
MGTRFCCREKSTPSIPQLALSIDLGSYTSSTRLAHFGHNRPIVLSLEEASEFTREYFSVYLGTGGTMKSRKFVGREGRAQAKLPDVEGYRGVMHRRPLVWLLASAMAVLNIGSSMGRFELTGSSLMTARRSADALLRHAR